MEIERESDSNGCEMEEKSEKGQVLDLRMIFRRTINQQNNRG